MSTLFRDLEQEVARALLPDRQRLRRLLRSIQKADQDGKPFDRNLARLTADIEASVARREQRIANVPVIAYDDELPISARRDEIAAAIRDHQVVVVCGETGSGKSTQLPKICLELGRGIDGLIGHTQPRRIAARSVASRIADELKSPLGRAVGFKIRFTDITQPDTYIKLMTDGILLAESQRDRFLDQYDTLILDEAHERSLNIDFLLGYLQRLLPRRRDLKVIITSATIDAERFAAHFPSTLGPAPVVQVSGRTYPVEVRYRPLTDEEDVDDPDWQRGIFTAVEECAADSTGDILIFLPTERDIHETAKTLRARQLTGDYPGRESEILPLYARLSTAEQNRVFQSHPHRRIVLATNVAESSLTVPGIRYVIDPGTARISRYSARSKMQRLPIEAISQASADQRKGRCGRVGPGICLRLYSQQDYESRERFTPPEIQRTNLAAVILQTKALGLGEIEDFPFLDPPRPEAVRDGYKTLFEIGALDEEQSLTDLGRRLNRIPVDPRIARIILAGQDEHCLHEILIIASALELQDPRERPLDKQQAADESHAQFTVPDSDFLSYLKLWDFYQKLKSDLSSNQLRKACRQNFLSYNRLREWADVHRQLQQLVGEAGLRPAARKDDYNAIHRALLTGLLSNVAFRGETNEYTVAGGGKVYLWPGSGAFEKKPKWIVAAELVETTRRYVRTVARIDPAWIEKLAAHLVSRSYSDPFWDGERGSATAYEKVSLFGLTIVPRRRVSYGPIDPAKSRELFLQHGLVEGDFQTQAPFFEHNRALLEEVENLQTRSRRPGFLKGEEARFDFFDRVIPAEVYDGPRFEKWRRAAERDNPRLLYLTAADLVEEETAAAAPGDFPDAISVRQMQLPLDYRFQPGDAADGITLTIPQEGLNQLDPQRLGWLVPGLIEEKIVALIKTLPKAIRRQFVPIPDTARQILRDLRFGEGALPQAVAAALEKLSGERISPDLFDPSLVPEHLRMNVRVVDAQGEPLATGRDLTDLRRKVLGEASAESSAIDDPRWKRDGLTKWDFGDLPAFVEMTRGGVQIRAFPAIVDQGETVSLRLLDSPPRAARETRAGLRRLFVLANKRELKAQVDWLPGLNQMLLHAAAFPDARNLKTQITDLIADRAFLEQELPRTASVFEQALRAGRARIPTAVQDVTNLVGPLLQGAQQARAAMGRANSPLWQYACEDLRTQVAGLMEAGFLTSTEWGWLIQYPRYFRAIQARLQKLATGGLARDQRQLAEFQPRWQAFAERVAQHRSQALIDPALIYYRWMLEEFRVSLFAQELGTAIPVSAKRLDEQWAKVQR